MAIKNMMIVLVKLPSPQWCSEKSITCYCCSFLLSSHTVYVEKPFVAVEKLCEARTRICCCYPLRGQSKKKKKRAYSCTRGIEKCLQVCDRSGFGPRRTGSRCHGSRAGEIETFLKTKVAVGTVKTGRRWISVEGPVPPCALLSSDTGALWV